MKKNMWKMPFFVPWIKKKRITYSGICEYWLYFNEKFVLHSKVQKIDYLNVEFIYFHVDAACVCKYEGNKQIALFNEWVFLFQPTVWYYMSVND